MKLTKEVILKIADKLKAAHNKKQKRWASEDKTYVPREWRGFSIPYRPVLGIFKYKARSKNTFNPETFEARSYDHWVYVKKINGKVVFNDYNYSMTTNGHQSAMRHLLQQLGIKIDLVVEQGQGLDMGLDNALAIQYLNIFKAELEQQRPNAKSRKPFIKECKQKIKDINALGFHLNIRQIQELKERADENEARRKERMQQAADARKVLRDRLKAIAKADPKDLNSRDVETETNSEVRRALVQRIGIVRLLKDLKAKVLDTQGSYELVDLKLVSDNRSRPYLKMINPSTGEVHVEGVPAWVNTVKQALAWRNQNSEYVQPVKLT